MATWGMISVFCTFFVAIGASFDRLLTYKWKAKIHLKLISWWNKLDETPAPDLFIRTINWLIRNLDALAQRKLRAFLSLLLFCFTSVWIANVLGIFTKDPSETVSVNVDLTGIVPDFFDLLEGPHIFVFFTVLFFDVILFLITNQILRQFQKGRPLRNFLVFLVYGFSTVLLMINCFSAFITVQFFAINNSVIGMKWEYAASKAAELEAFNYYYEHDSEWRSRFEKDGATKLSKNATVVDFSIVNSYWTNLKKTPNALWQALTEGRGLWDTSYKVKIIDPSQKKQIKYERMESFHLERSFFFICGSLTLPVFSLILVQIFLIAAKSVLETLRRIIMYFLDLSTEPAPQKFAPGTLIGVVFALLLATGNLFADLISRIWK